MHGKNTYFNLDSTDISTYLKNKTLDESTDNVDVSTFGDDAKEHIPGLDDGTISLEGPWDETIDELIDSHDGGGEQAFIYCPAGNTSTYVKYTGNCIFTSYNISGGNDQETKFTATYQVTEGVTEGTVT